MTIEEITHRIEDALDLLDDGEYEEAANVLVMLLNTIEDEEEAEEEE